MRGVWIAACVIGLLGSIALAGTTALALFEARDNRAAFMDLLGQSISWLVLLVGFGGACVVGLTLSRKQIESAMAEEEPQRAAWLEELNAGSGKQAPNPAPETDTDRGSAS